MTRYRASFLVDAQTPSQALELARDAMRPRAATTRDGKAPVLTVAVEPALPRDAMHGVLRVSWTGADAEVGGRDVTIAYEQPEDPGAQRPRARGIIALYREAAEPQVETLTLTPAKMAELCRAIRLFPLDHMDARAMADLRRRAGEHEGHDAFGDMPTLTGGERDRR